MKKISTNKKSENNISSGINLKLLSAHKLAFEKTTPEFWGGFYNMQ